MTERDGKVQEFKIPDQLVECKTSFMGVNRRFYIRLTPDQQHEDFDIFCDPSGVSDGQVLRIQRQEVQASD